jgi:hypothetical protein
MAKSIRKKSKRAGAARKTRESARGQGKADEYIGCLIELHKLQGLLLSHLRKQI